MFDRDQSRFAKTEGAMLLDAAGGVDLTLKWVG
jgi:hypothetical protein